MGDIFILGLGGHYHFGATPFLSLSLRTRLSHQNLISNWNLGKKKATIQLMTIACIHTDETSLRVDKQNHWIHVYSGGKVTLKFLHRKRGKEAMDAIEIIPHYGGVIVHDCWASYLSYDHLKHGLCGSHLLRELTFIVDSNIIDGQKR